MQRILDGVYDSSHLILFVMRTYAEYVQSTCGPECAFEKYIYATVCIQITKGMYLWMKITFTLLFGLFLKLMFLHFFSSFHLRKIHWVQIIFVEVLQVNKRKYFWGWCVKINFGFEHNAPVDIVQNNDHISSHWYQRLRTSQGVKKLKHETDHPSQFSTEVKNTLICLRHCKHQDFTHHHLNWSAYRVKTLIGWQQCHLPSLKPIICNPLFLSPPNSREEGHRESWWGLAKRESE
jgi:hypothetical protein